MKIKLIIKENKFDKLNEEILKNKTAILYHGSRDLDVWLSIHKKEREFESKRAFQIYGKGIYCVFGKDLSSKTFGGSYGQYIIKIATKITNKFLILEEDVYRNIYGEDKYFIEKQCKKLNIPIFSIPESLKIIEEYRSSNFPSDFQTSLILKSFFGKYDETNLDGIIYEDKVNGKCCLLSSPHFEVLGYYEAFGGGRISEFNRNIKNSEVFNSRNVQKTLSRIELADRANNEIIYKEINMNEFKQLQEHIKAANKCNLLLEHYNAMNIKRKFKEVSASQGTPFVMISDVARASNTSPEEMKKYLDFLKEQGSVRFSGTNIAVVPAKDRPYIYYFNGEPCLLFQIK